MWTNKIELFSDLYIYRVRKVPHKNIYVKSMSNPRNLRGLRGCTFIHKLSTWIPRGYFPRG